MTAQAETDRLVAELQAMLDKHPRRPDDPDRAVFSHRFNRRRTKEIGERLHAIGGKALMQEAIQLLSTPDDIDLWELDRAWDGIGGWVTTWPRRMAECIAEAFFHLLAMEAVGESLLGWDEIHSISEAHEAWHSRFPALQAACERVLTEGEKPAPLVRDYLTVKLRQGDG